MNNDLITDFLYIKGVVENCISAYAKGFGDETLLNLGHLMAKTGVLYDKCSNQFAQKNGDLNG